MEAREHELEGFLKKHEPDHGEKSTPTSTVNSFPEAYYDEPHALPLVEPRRDISSGHGGLGPATRDHVISFVSCKGGLLKCVHLLRPSFLSCFTRSASSQQLRPTAWLDGLRGTSAFMVVIHHHSGMWYMGLWQNTYHGPLDWLFQLPFIKFFYFAGYLYVAIFFVISGYSLSYKPLSLCRTGQSSQVFESLSSSAFRRPFRLFIPPVFVSFLGMLFVHLGWTVDGVNSPPRAATFTRNLQLWFADAVALCDPFKPMAGLTEDLRYYPAYNPHLWTIPVEFQGSMAIFLVLLALAKVSPLTRMTTITIIVSYCFYYEYLHHAVFITGILMAEINMISAQIREHPFCKTVWDYRHSGKIREGIVFFFIALSFSLAMSTERLERLSAMLIVACVNYSPLLQSLFTCRFALYLGRISFSLYMVHGLVILNLCWWLMPFFGDRIRNTPLIDFRFVLTTVVTSLVSFPLTFWFADVVTRCVDEKSVSFAQWLWRRVAN